MAVFLGLCCDELELLEHLADFLALFFCKVVAVSPRFLVWVDRLESVFQLYEDVVDCCFFVEAIHKPCSLEVNTNALSPGSVKPNPHVVCRLPAFTCAKILSRIIHFVMLP